MVPVSWETRVSSGLTSPALLSALLTFLQIKMTLPLICFPIFGPDLSPLLLLVSEALSFSLFFFFLLRCLIQKEKKNSVHQKYVVNLH